jgi:hypothetical protein
LFLGLSDGARIDVFRRSTNMELTHEQIWQTYEVTSERGENILSELRKDLVRIVAPDSGADMSLFRMVFLLDDFSGSGITYLRKEGDGKKIGGKIAKFWDQLQSAHTGLSKLVNLDDLYVGIVLYIATRQAIDHMQELFGELSKESPGVQFRAHVVQLLDSQVGLDVGRDAGFLDLAQNYYDPIAETDHTRKGGTDVRRGFAGCALPVVLSHNTPNNSVFLLWADPEQHRVRGLFPRVSRHRSEP